MPQKIVQFKMVFNFYKTAYSLPKHVLMLSYTKNKQSKKKFTVYCQRQIQKKIVTGPNLTYDYFNTCSILTVNWLSDGLVLQTLRVDYVSCRRLISPKLRITKSITQKGQLMEIKPPKTTSGMGFEEYTCSLLQRRFHET